MIYQLSYDLKGPDAEYNALYDAINTIGDSVRILGSTWLIDSCRNAEQITDELSSKIKVGDRFFVSQVNRGQYNGWHSKSIWEWISTHMNSNPKGGNPTPTPL